MGCADMIMAGKYDMIGVWWKVSVMGMVVMQTLWKLNSTVVQVCNPELDLQYET